MKSKKLLFIILCYFFIFLIICCDMSPAPVLEEHINKYSKNINEIEDNSDKKDTTEFGISIFFPSSKNNTWILLRLNQSIFYPIYSFPKNIIIVNIIYMRLSYGILLSIFKLFI